jgi:hypothetical protein
MTGEGVREVVVLPRGARRETLGVFGAIALILALCAARVALLRPGGGATAGPAAAVLTGSDGLIYQSLLVAVDAVATLRESEGGWPSPERLAKEDMPPFAAGLLPQELRDIRWEARPRGSGADGVDYIGRDTSGSRTAFLLRMDRDRPAGALAPRISVQIWIHDGKGATAPAASPASSGWMRLVELDGQAASPANRKAP